MKKRTLILFVLLLALLLTACGQKYTVGGIVSATEAHRELADHVAMEIVEKTLTRDGVTILVKNDTGAELYSGPGYGLEVWQQDGWHRLEPKEEWSTTAEMYGIEKEWRAEINWRFPFGSLPKGRYRIVKSFCAEEGAIRKEFQKRAEFTLS